MFIKPVLFLLLLCSLSAHAQQSLRDGWVQVNNGDTLFGKIQERDWNTNPEQISFSGSVKQTYAVADLRSFGLTGGDVYRRYTVSRWLMPVSDDAVLPDSTASSDQVTAWLRVLVPGTTTLASLNQPARRYFYLIDASGTITELLYGKGVRNYMDEKYRNDPNYGKSIVSESAVFRNQLMALFPGKLSPEQALQLQYGERSLVRLFQKLNNVRATREAGTMTIGISGGASLFNSKVNGDLFTLFKGTSFKNVLMPFVKVSFNFNKSARRSRISLIPETGFSLFNTTGTKTTPTINADFDIKNLFWEAGVVSRINLNPAAKSRFFIDLGINSYLRISGKNTYTDRSTPSNPIVTNEPEQNSFFIAPSVSAGVSTSSLAIFLNYQHPGNITQYQNSSWVVGRTSVGITYYVKRK